MLCISTSQAAKFQRDKYGEQIFSGVIHKGGVSHVKTDRALALKCEKYMFDSM